MTETNQINIKYINVEYFSSKKFHSPAMSSTAWFIGVMSVGGGGDSVGDPSSRVIDVL